MSTTKEAERLEFLGSLQRGLETQDNRGTENPMFCVRGKRRIYGMDPEFTDNTVWMDSENGVIPCEAPADGQETEFITKTAYLDVWDTLMVAFTEAGCKRHLELNGHNYDNYEEVQIYVRSFNRCPEMVSIREMLASGDLAALQTRLASAEANVLNKEHKVGANSARDEELAKLKRRFEALFEEHTQLFFDMEAATPLIQKLKQAGDEMHSVLECKICVMGERCCGKCSSCMAGSAWIALTKDIKDPK